jgi:hypothetical protein
MHLGIDEKSGLVYEGIDRVELPAVPTRLHARGKSNEAYSKSLRDPVDEDAELALHALGLALHDIGWAGMTENAGVHQVRIHA